MSISYDPYAVYPDNEKFTIPGRVLNGIGRIIRDLEVQIKNTANEAMEKELEELRLRDKNPSLKDAWDKYQTMLNLVKERS